MANSSVTIDNTEVFAMIEGMIKRMEEPEPLLKSIGKYIQAETKKMFVTGRPDNSPVRGESWPPLAHSTILKKFRKKTGIASNALFSRPLVDTGLLRDDLMAPRAIKVQNKGLIYGTERRNKKGYLYPAIHQTGSRDGMHPPKRRWLFLTEQDLFQIGKTTVAWLEGRKYSLISMRGKV